MGYRIYKMGESLLYHRLHNKSYTYPVWAKYEAVLSWTYTRTRKTRTWDKPLRNTSVKCSARYRQSGEIFYLRESIYYPYVRVYIKGGGTGGSYTSSPYFFIGSAESGRTMYYGIGPSSEDDDHTYFPVYEYKAVQKLSSTAQLLGYVRAPEGTYPNDGLHSDGYWYILQE